MDGGFVPRRATANAAAQFPLGRVVLECSVLVDFQFREWSCGSVVWKSGSEA